MYLLLRQRTDWTLKLNFLTRMRRTFLKQRSKNIGRLTVLYHQYHLSFVTFAYKKCWTTAGHVLQVGQEIHTKSQEMIKIQRFTVTANERPGILPIQNDTNFRYGHTVANGVPVIHTKQTYHANSFHVSSLLICICQDVTV